MAVKGSSPRVRGKRHRRVVDGVERGLIPARAGKTPRGGRHDRHGRAHPRACGENTTPTPENARAVGSSPRVRGKRGRGREGRRLRGLIPACAGKTTEPTPSRENWRAHPRVCGENAYSRATRSASSGSSPRVRGKLVQQGQILVRHGLIPACAGKTLRLLGRRRGPGAHPRVCGENQVLRVAVDPESGSSPRVRGKQEGAGGEPCRVGLIPACAGKTGSPASLTSGGRAHPRVCGENEGALRSVLARWGSSPRVRGKLTPITIVAIPTRLIPACAGKTVRDRSRAAADRAHPRVCGENALVVWENVEGAGSSPRVRGKPIRSFTASRTLRLIPACAGKTQLPERGVHAPRAHPRVCGENVANAETMSRAEGSSPRVRGKRDHHRAHRRPRRLIPACAGKTFSQSQQKTPETAHPRVCGENAMKRAGDTRLDGSSPRVRGKRADRCAGQPRVGLIPACAGKTSPAPAPGAAGTAHPRVCGENAGILGMKLLAAGSSPRVRGKHRRLPQPHRERGLIPACAGKTTPVQGDGRSRGAHPRVCGENPEGRTPSYFETGLIPACAGKTPSHWGTRIRVTAHPRVCGENSMDGLVVNRETGSSPRVRGKLHARSATTHTSWLIPACAGKTSSGRVRAERQSAHPRVCGENLHMPMSKVRDWGSSPRVRGKLNNLIRRT